MDAFKSRRLDDADFWTGFEQVLALGGAFADPNTFVAPCVAAKWPDGPDGFECYAITGAGVRLRREPRADAPVVKAVDYVVVRIVDGGHGTPDWMPIQLGEGPTGYVAARYLRSPADLRAIFEFKSGQWWLTGYPAGEY